MSNSHSISQEDFDLFDLGVLSPQESESVRQILATSDEARKQYLSRSVDDALIGFALRPQEHSVDARDNFMRAMRHEQPAPSVSSVASSTPARSPKRSGFGFWPIAALGSLAALLAVVSGVLLIQNKSYREANQSQSAVLSKQEQNLQSQSAALANHDQDLQVMQAKVAHAQQAEAVLSMLQSADTSRFVLTSAKTAPQPQVRTFFRKSTGQVVLLASALPALPAGKTYELWLIATDGGAPVPAGTFAPDARGNVSATLTHTAANRTPKMFAVTVEQAAGATTPTMPIVFSGAQGL